MPSLCISTLGPPSPQMQENEFRKHAKDAEQTALLQATSGRFQLQISFCVKMPMQTDKTSSAGGKIYLMLLILRNIPKKEPPSTV